MLGVHLALTDGGHAMIVMSLAMHLRGTGRGSRVCEASGAGRGVCAAACGMTASGVRVSLARPPVPRVSSR